MRNILNNFSRIYFCGILGVSMSGLAKDLALKGKIVAGSDLGVNGVDELKKYGIKVFGEHSIENVKNFSSDIFVYSSAIKQDNPELLYAKQVGIPIYKRSQILGEIMRLNKTRIGISGSHGKTTATAMLAKCLIEGGKDPKVFLGGESLEFGNFRRGKGQVVLAEACEYDKNFLDIPVNYAVVLNVDNDHSECYQGMSDIIGTFGRFCEGAVSLVNVDDENCRSIINSTTVTFGINNPAVYNAKRIKYNGIGYSFSLFRNGVAKVRINLSVSGYHNIYNALSACAISDMLGVSWQDIKNALEKFKGVKRRMESLGDWQGIKFIADYAHHPKEISATIKTLEESGKDFAIIFQPHTYSRTKILMKDFVDVLSKVERLIIYKTYPAREIEDESANAKALYEKVKKESINQVEYADNELALKRVLKKQANGVTKAIFVGAGDIYEIAKKIIKN